MPLTSARIDGLDAGANSADAGADELLVEDGANCPDNEHGADGLSDDADGLNNKCRNKCRVHKNGKEYRDGQRTCNQCQDTESEFSGQRLMQDAELIARLEEQREGDLQKQHDPSLRVNDFVTELASKTKTTSTTTLSTLIATPRRSIEGPTKVLKLRMRCLRIVSGSSSTCSKTLPTRRRSSN